MRKITVSRELSAPRTAVWDVLADFPNIAGWNRGVIASWSTSESTEGVGAMRHCDLKPFGKLEETVTEWVPSERMAIRIDAAPRLPIASGLVTFTLASGGDGDGDSATTGVTYEYAPKFGPVGRLLGPLFDRQLRTGFSGFLADLETEARERATAT